MKVKVNELSGIQLDWAVAKAGGCSESRLEPETFLFIRMQGAFRFTSEWSEAGPIIERERLCLHIGHDGVWLACIRQNYDDEAEHMVAANTPLIAAMRCFCLAKLGNEVEIPEELI